MESAPDLTFLDNKPLFNIWLHSLNRQGRHRASKKLLAILQVLDQQSRDPANYFDLLECLSPTVIHFADELEEIVIAKQCFKANAFLRQSATLSCQLLRMLSLNYCKVALCPTLTPEHRSPALIAAINCIGLSQRKYATLKHLPSQTLWQMSVALYRYAEKLQLLVQAQSISSTKTQPTNFAAILKRNLLFSLCKPYRFNQAAIEAIFNFANLNNAFLDLQIRRDEAEYRWRFRQATAPYRLDSITTNKVSGLYLSLKKINASDKIFLPPALTHLIDELSGYPDIIASARHNAFQAGILVHDFNNIHRYLSQLAILNNINRIACQPGQKSQPLKPLQLSARKTMSPLKLSNKTTYIANNSFFAIGVTLYPTANSNYLVTAAVQQQLDFEMPVLIQAGETQTRLGFIRQIETHTDNKSQRFLIELHEGQVESVKIILNEEDFSIQMGLLITNTDGQKEILLPVNRHPNGTLLSIKQATETNNYYLDHCIAATAYYLHYTLSNE